MNVELPQHDVVVGTSVGVGSVAVDDRSVEHPAALTPSTAMGLTLVVAGIGMVMVGQRRAARKRDRLR